MQTLRQLIKETVIWSQDAESEKKRLLTYKPGPPQNGPLLNVRLPEPVYNTRWQGYLSDVIDHQEEILKALEPWAEDVIPRLKGPGDRIRGRIQVMGFLGAYEVSLVLSALDVEVVDYQDRSYTQYVPLVTYPDGPEQEVIIVPSMRGDDVVWTIKGVEYSAPLSAVTPRFNVKVKGVIILSDGNQIRAEKSTPVDGTLPITRPDSGPLGPAGVTLTMLDILTNRAVNNVMNTLPVAGGDPTPLPEA